jgi:hypothetical protein
MGIIIAAVIGIIILWLVSDFISKNKELNSDPTLAGGLKKKYPNLFSSFQNDGFNITTQKRDEVKMVRVADGIGFSISVEITVMYQAGNRIQFIVQLYLLHPKRHMKTKSFYYSSLITEEGLRKRATDEIGVFLFETLNKN